MKIIIFLIFLFLFLRKKNCNSEKKEHFSDTLNRNNESGNQFFNHLQNDIIQKQSIRNLLF